uniref:BRASSINOSTEROID INSENSITIVE 1-associated receptor kinase 1-like n=1 Tax=Rhizophora mucronata TaxID=61149 RepID=A0A2P2QZZ5_RHIMU
MCTDWQGYYPNSVECC